jgi:hypothetical protein
MSPGLSIRFAVLAFGVLVAVAGARSSEVSRVNAPTGLYVSVTDIPARFTIDLRTNGVYSVLATGLRTNTQTGTWTWEVGKDQFLLTPTTNGGTFEYRFRILRVDPWNPETLKWIPDGGPGKTRGTVVDYRGTVDYVRFQRKNQR